MHAAIRTALINAARRRDLVYYGDIAPLAGLDMGRDDHRVEIGRLLGEISEYEHARGNPLLSAVVVRKDDPTSPGDGFFTLAKSLGLLKGDKDAFFTAELRRVFSHPW